MVVGGAAGSAVILLLAVACAHDPRPPRPTEMVVSRPHGAVLASAKRQLERDGFVIAEWDSADGHVLGRLTRYGNVTWRPLVDCEWGETSIEHGAGLLTLTQRVAVRKAPEGSHVLIAGLAHVKIQGGLMLHRESDSECASTGEEERRIADALVSAAN